MLDLINQIKNGPPPLPVIKDRPVAGSWTTKEEATLQDLAGRYSKSDIAKRMGRSQKAVEQRACMLGVSLSITRISTTLVDMARHLSDAGYTDEQIARAFGCGKIKAKALAIAVKRSRE